MKWTDRNMMTVGFSVCLGVFCISMPASFLEALAPAIRVFFGSSVLVTFILAWIMYVALSYRAERKKS
jgi:uncharacterized membrane protein